jgi:hypothetical protein
MNCSMAYLLPLAFIQNPLPVCQRLFGPAHTPQKGLEYHHKREYNYCASGRGVMIPEPTPLSAFSRVATD